MINRIYHWASLQPESPALIFEDVSLSYAAFWRSIEASRSFLDRQKLPVGSTAVVLVHSLLDSWICVMGLRSAGLNTICVASIAQIETLGLKDICCVVVTQAETGRHQLTSNALAGVCVIELPATILANSESGELQFDHSRNIPFGGHILYTSGTTGINKNVLMSGAKEARRNDARARSWSFGKRTVFHGVDFPLSTGAGFKQPSAVWHAGGCVVLDQRPDLFSRFFDHPITNVALVPTMLKNLLQAGRSSEPFQNDLEVAVGAGFLSMGLAERAARQLTKKIEIQYGSTELAICVLHSYFHRMDDLHWLIPAAGCTVEIADRNGAECPIGQEGELRIAVTDIDCSSYLGDSEASARVFREGYFYPGDLAVQRTDGRIRILGRTADVLNYHGHKIPVAPIEHQIQRFLGVDDVCIFSGLNENGDEELGIAIQSANAIPELILKSIRSSFASFERVRFVSLKEFPHSDTGMRKVQRTALRQLVFSGDAASDMDSADSDR